MFPRALLLPVVLSLVFAAPSDAQCPTPLVRPEPVVAGHGMVDPEDRFGSAVALGGGLDVLSRLPLYAAIGAPRDGGGTVAAYEVGPEGLGVPQTIAHRETRTEDAFGFAVALAQNAGLLAIGAPFHDEPNGRGDAGKVYLYTRGLGGWIEQASLVAPDLAGSDHFGWAVALSQDGGTLVVGAPGRSRSGRETGAVLVFQQAGGAWRFVRELGVGTLSAPGDRFGSSVAIDASGQTIVAGAPGLTSEAQLGRGRAFQFSGDTVSSLGEGGQPAASYGYAVAIGEDGRRIAIGAPGADGEKGSITIVKNGRTESVLGPTCSGGDSSPQLGYSLAMAGDLLIAGARRDQGGTGLAYIYRCSEASCGTAARILPTSDVGSDAEMGRAVALLGDLALIGAPLDAGKAGKAVAYDLGGVVVSKPNLTGVDGRYIPGKELTLTYEVANRSAERIDLSVDLRFPADLKAPQLCRQVSGAGRECSLAILEPGHAIDSLRIQGPAVATYEITGMIPPGVRGDIEAVSAPRIPGGFFELTPDGLVQSDHRTLEPRATLQMDLLPPSERPVPGESKPAVFKLFVKNAGPSSILKSYIVARIDNNPKRIDRVSWCKGGDACITRPSPTPCDTDSHSQVECRLDQRPELKPGETMEFRIFGKVPADALRNINLEASSEPRRGEPGERKTSRTIQLDPQAVVKVSVDTLPGNDQDTLVPGGAGQRLTYDVTIEHTRDQPSFVRGVRLEASRDPELACQFSCLRSTRRQNVCKIYPPLAADIKNLAIGDRVVLRLDCGLLPAGAANFRGAIPGPTFEPSHKMPDSPGISVLGSAGSCVKLKPNANLALDLDPIGPNRPIVPGEASSYSLQISNRGDSESPLTRLFPCDGHVEDCPQVKLDCHDGIECISDPAGAEFSSVCVFPLKAPFPSIRRCDAEVTFAAAARGNLEVTARARPVWPHSDAGPTQRMMSRVDRVEPHASLQVAIDEPMEISIDPVPPADAALTGVQFKVKVANAGPSDALGVKTSLVLPALLPADTLTWHLDENPDSSQGGNSPWTLNVPAEKDPLRKGKTLIAAGPLANPDPTQPLRGPLVLRSSSDSGDAQPSVDYNSGFLSFHVKAAREAVSAALVVEGKFEPEGHVCYRAFLDNNTRPSGTEEDDDEDVEFSLKLDPALTFAPDFTDCPKAEGVTDDPDDDGNTVVRWHGKLPRGTVASLQFGAQISATPTRRIPGQANLHFHGEDSLSHCPYLPDDSSPTVFEIPDPDLPADDPLPALCGGFSTVRPTTLGR